MLLRYLIADWSTIPGRRSSLIGRRSCNGDLRRRTSMGFTRGEALATGVLLAIGALGLLGPPIAGYLALT